MDDRDVGELFDLLKSIDASLKLLVDRTAPPVRITINDLPLNEAEALSRGLADLNAGRVTDFIARTR